MTTLEKFEMPHIATIDVEGKRYNVALRIDHDGVEFVGRLWFSDEAWAEVLTLSPDAAIPGMSEQFLCHWQFAELIEPGKISWNLEPWRPEVSAEEMATTGCNPGGTEEPF